MANTNPVKVAMIGVGAISGIYLKNITNVFKEVELVGVCDLIPERAEKGVQTVKEYIEAGAKAPVPKIYKDMYEAFNDPEVEVVLNLTRPYEHYGVTKAALEHGKHVLCEKPMALTREACAHMIAAAEATGKKLMVGQVCRYAPAFAKAKELIDAGEIGELYYVESEYAHDYLKVRGANDWRVDPMRYGLLGGGCHAMDLLSWIAGRPNEVFAYSNHKMLKDWPTDDTTIAVLKYPGDVIGKVFCSISCNCLIQSEKYRF